MDRLARLSLSHKQLRTSALAAVALLFAACGGGGSSGGGSPPPPPPPPAAVTINGLAQYEFVPPNPVCQGLDFASTELRPIRAATVQLLDNGGAELATTTTDDSGGFSFSGVDIDTDVRIRIRAELKRQGSPGWDVDVRDNVIDPDDPNPPALAARPLYAIISDFNTGSDPTLERTLTARTGWDGDSYSGTRSAAPFAVLDAIYTAMQTILDVDPGVSFPPLDAFWSISNGGTDGIDDIDTGEFGVSFYSRDIDSLFLLGDANSDTEEFDSHVVVHEWGHYFEDVFSRSDSLGGAHFIGDQLDPRVAFGEGWATAFAGIALNDPVYCDTALPGPGLQPQNLALGTEEGAYDAQGWYDEVSVIRFIYDLWDTTNGEDGLETDSGSIGFAPIYDTLVGPQTSTKAWTSVFSFATELRSQLPPAQQALLDEQLAREDMTPGFDIWGDGELNDAGAGTSVLPIYAEVSANGTTVNVCATHEFDRRGDNNKLGERRFLRFDVPSTGTYEIVVQTDTSNPDYPPDDPADDRDQSDPDLYFFIEGAQQFFSLSPDANEERITTELVGPETYVVELVEFRFFDPETPNFDADPSTPGILEPICYDVSVTAQ
jgi:hypothetical protein